MQYSLYHMTLYHMNEMSRFFVFCVLLHAMQNNQ